MALAESGRYLSSSIGCFAEVLALPEEQELWSDSHTLFLGGCEFRFIQARHEVPDTRDVGLKTIVDDVMAARGKETKEAEPFPLQIVVALELAFTEWVKDKPALAIFTWWVLIMIYGSLRFDTLAT